VEEVIKLNLGCGSHSVKGWINIDMHRGADIPPDYQGDITDRDWLTSVILTEKLVHSENDVDDPAGRRLVCTADEILVSHTLEHFEWSTDPLWMWVELLKPGGRFIAVVPDALHSCQLADIGLIGKDWLVNIVFGMDRQGPRPELQHHRVYTPSILIKELREHGLVSVQRVVKGQERWKELVEEGVIHADIEEQIVCEGWKP
jgi:predicted SAM-dependent methyltransferase